MTSAAPAASALREEWRDVVGFEGRYRVSSLGRVFSAYKDDVLEGTKPQGPYTYHTVRLYKNGKMHGRAVHKIMAEAFLGPRPSPVHQVRHLDGDHTNNQLDNIVWGTPKENAADRARHGRDRIGAAHHATKISDEQVIFLRQMRGRISTRALAERLGVNPSTVLAIQNGKSRRHVTRALAAAAEAERSADGSADEGA